MKNIRFKFDQDQLKDTNFKYIIGIDEVGWGCVAGELVLGGALIQKSVYFDENPPEFFELVKDSKKVSEKKRHELINELNKNSKIKVAVGESSVDVINTEGLAKAYSYAIDQIFDQFKDVLSESLILIDGNRNPKSSKVSDYKLIIKGDDASIVMGIASNWAKEYRDQLMKKHDISYPGYDFANNVGYGTPKHKAGLISLGLTKIHRIEPSQKLIRN